MEKEQYIFHGGCHRCTRQGKVGVDECRKCCYFLPNWDLPNLNNKPISRSEKKKQEIIEKYKEIRHGE